MRGIEPTVMTRLYRSDNDEMTRWLAIKNAGKRKKRMARADAWRAIIKENQRMKARIRFLEVDNARMLRNVNEVKRIQKVYTV